MPGTPEKLVVMGQGYAGLPLAVTAAERGYHVVGYDIDESRVKMLAEGHSFVSDVSSERLAAVLSRGSYLPSMDTEDLAGFDVAVITVPTPMRHGVPDLSHIESAGMSIGAGIRPDCTVILESTSYPGTTEDVLLPILQKESGLLPGTDFWLGYSPERIDPGNTDWRFENTPKVVAGIEAVSLERTSAFYASLVGDVIAARSPRVAELAKVLENTFRHVNIALVNELAVHCEGLGIDVWDVVDIAATKPFGYMRFTPGPGVGGHCLPVDPLYLNWKVGHSLSRRFRMVELADELNRQMPEYVVRRLTRGLDRRHRTVNGSRILLLGLAYKPNTGDVRESPALEIASRLTEAGASVRVADPHVATPLEVPGLTQVEATAGEVAKADAVLVVTDHDCFDYELVATSARYVLDTRHRLRPRERIEFL